MEANNKQVFIKYILIEAVRNWAPFNFGEIKTAELLEIVLFQLITSNGSSISWLKK